MLGLKKITFRKILNSHVSFTNEFVIELDNGNTGIGSAPYGETISIYEAKDRVGSSEIQAIIDQIYHQDFRVSQDSFDTFLEGNIESWGRSNCYALSLALFNALDSSEPNGITKRQSTTGTSPNLCLNILNGGKHAYTNPVLSDFPEYLLMSKNNDVESIVQDHAEIQNKVHEQLKTKRTTTINGNEVHRFETTDNRECIEFLLNILESLKLNTKYDLMIDASGGDLREKSGYSFVVTNQSMLSNEEMLEYWLDLAKQYPIKYLEDPFHETDFVNWQSMTTLQNGCNIIGDNFYSSDPDKLIVGIHNRYTNGLILKPDQSGTISRAISAARTAKSHDQIVISSHRSISTESLFLSTFTNLLGLHYIKIGPLFSDYSSVLRLNELIRLTQPVK